MSTFIDVVTRLNHMLSALHAIDPAFIDNKELNILREKIEILIEQISLLESEYIIDNKYQLMDKAIDLRIKTAYLLERS